jgi:hypothetical protein
MYDTLLELYIDGEIDIIGLDVAVNKQWIKPEERQKIIDSKSNLNK